MTKKTQNIMDKQQSSDDALMHIDSNIAILVCYIK